MSPQPQYGSGQPAPPRARRPPTRRSRPATSRPQPSPRRPGPGCTPGNAGGPAPAGDQEPPPGTRPARAAARPPSLRAGHRPAARTGHERQRWKRQQRAWQTGRASGPPGTGGRRQPPALPGPRAYFQHDMPSSPARDHPVGGQPGTISLRNQAISLSENAGALGVSVWPSTRRALAGAGPKLAKASTRMSSRFPSSMSPDHNPPCPACGDGPARVVQREQPRRLSYLHPVRVPTCGGTHPFDDRPIDESRYRFVPGPVANYQMLLDMVT